MLVWVVLWSPTSGCSSSLVEDGGAPLYADTDSVTEPFEPIATAQDDRVLGPTSCTSDTDCEDGDPCTIGTCPVPPLGQTERRCSYTHKTIAVTAALAPTTGAARALAFDGDILYVAEGPSGVEVFEITSPSVLNKTAQVAQPDGGHALDIAANQSGFIIAMGKGGIQTFSGPPTFSPLSRVDAGSGELRSVDTIVSVDTCPGYALGGGYGDGAVLFNIGDLSNPYYSGRLNSQGRVVNTALFPPSTYDHAFIADSLLGALVLSFNTPEGWAFVDQISTKGRVEDVAVAGQTGLFSEWGEGFGVADLSNPDDVDRLSRVPTASPVLSVALLGPRTGVVGEENGTITFWDLSNGKVPVRLAIWSGSGLIHSLGVRDGTVGAAMGSKGVAVLTTGCEAVPEATASDP